MYIIFVEDDHLEMEDADSDIREAFPNSDVEHIRTEKGFVSWLDEIAEKRPDVFIIDMLVRWTSSSPNMEEPPEEVEKGGFFRAGLRCINRLLATEKTKKIPIILYTVLEESDLKPDLKRLPSNVTYLRKDLNIDPLIKRIGSVTHQSSK